jgi:hypothetical protein
MFDGAIPNGTQGDPAAGAVLVTQIPHETKDEPVDINYNWKAPKINNERVNLYAETRGMIMKQYDPFDTISAVINYAKTNPKAKKDLLQTLVKEGILTKASCAKLFGKKVRSSVGKHKRPKAGDRIKVPSSSPLES